MQAIDITRHSRLTQQLVPPTTVLSFICCSQVACKKKVAHDNTFLSGKYLMTYNETVFDVVQCALQLAVRQ
jgi:hypothetical protein